MAATSIALMVGDGGGMKWVSGQNPSVKKIAKATPLQAHNNWFLVFTLPLPGLANFM